MVGKPSFHLNISLNLFTSWHLHSFPSFQIANMIRFLVDSYNKPVPAILEIPSKDHPYDPAHDSVLSRVRYLFSAESVASGRRWFKSLFNGWNPCFTIRGWFFLSIFNKLPFVFEWPIHLDLLEAFLRPNCSRVMMMTDYSCILLCSCTFILTISAIIPDFKRIKYYNKWSHFIYVLLLIRYICIDHSLSASKAQLRTLAADGSGMLIQCQNPP